MTSTTVAPSTTHRHEDLALWRINLMRGGYLLMAVGLAVVKWPLLGRAASLPVFEGVTLCLLTAMSFMAVAGVLRPVQMLPVLVFETAWKALWFGLVAVPHLLAGDMDPETTRILVSFAPEVVIVAVTPWDYVWRAYGRARVEAWR